MWSELFPRRSRAGSVQWWENCRANSNTALTNAGAAVCPRLGPPVLCPVTVLSCRKRRPGAIADALPDQSVWSVSFWIRNILVARAYSPMARGPMAMIPTSLGIISRVSKDSGFLLLSDPSHSLIPSIYRVNNAISGDVSVAPFSTPFLSFSSAWPLVHTLFPLLHCAPYTWGSSFSILSLAGQMDLSKRGFKLKPFKSTAGLTWIPSLLLLLWTQTSVSPEEKIRWGLQCFPGNQLFAEKGRCLERKCWLCISGSRVEYCKNMLFRVKKAGFKFLLRCFLLLWASLFIFLSFRLLLY